MEDIISKAQSGSDDSSQTVSYKKLYSLASKSDKMIMYLGWLSSLLAGLVIPGFCYFVGHIIDSFDKYRTTLQ